MQEVRIQLIGGVDGMDKFPELMEHIGGWLSRYEPENARYGRQWVWTTSDPDQALKMPSDEAFTLIQKSVGTRLDGKPDRPIFAFHLQVEKVHAEEEDDNSGT